MVVDVRLAGRVSSHEPFYIVVVVVVGKNVLKVLIWESGGVAVV